jgi:hypothetical protein
MTDYSREKGTTNLTDMIDSGYSSIANSPDGKQSSKAPQLSPEVSRPPLFQIPGDLKRFEKDIDQATQDRFHDVTERVQGPLVEDMRKRFEPRDFQPMAMRLLVLGKDYNDAKPHLVVFCPPKTIKRVKKHFTRSQAKAICHPTDPLQISFEVIVIGLPLRLKNAASTVDIYGAANISTLVGWTSSSTLIRVSGETGDRYATMGGVIKIERDDQDFILCGLTAGHILEEFGVAPSFAEQSRHSEVSSDEETDDDEEMLDADTTIHCSNSPPSVDVPANVNIGTSWSKVGKITITGRSDEARNRDWALVEAIDSQFQKTNKVQKCGDFTKDPARELRLFRDKDMGEKFSRRALILTSGSHGSSLRGGYISNLPTMALLPSGTQFVPVYPMTLDDNSGMYTS